MTLNKASGERQRPMHLIRRESDADELAMHRHIADNAAQGIAVTDDAMNLIYVNPAFEKLHGVSRSGLLGRNLLDFGLSDNERERLAAAIDTGYREHGGWSGETEVVRPDGSRVPVLVSASSLLNDDGQTIGRVAMLTDISDLKEVEAKLRAVNEELDAYAQTVSHDLRSPLSAVVLANELLKEARDADIDHLRHELDESVRTIDRNARKAGSLINDLLSLAESGQKPAVVTEVDVTAVILRVLEEQDGAIRSRGVKVIKDRRFGVLRASETHVYQLFSNLIGNTITHNDNPKPAIAVRRLEDGPEGGHRYLVRDNSSGIPAGEVEKIFKPFYRRPSSGSTGLGLAIVKRIVDVYGGTLRFYNDGGACFELSLKDAED